MQSDSLRRIDRQYTMATTGLCGPVQYIHRLGIAGIIAIPIYIYTYREKCVVSNAVAVAPKQ